MLYSTIEYSPGWYYVRYPGFWNIECYRILSEYSHHPEKYVTDIEQEDQPVQEDEDLEVLTMNDTDVLECESSVLGKRKDF